MFGELMIHIRKKIRLRLDSHHAPKKSISDKDLNTKGKTLKLKGKKKGRISFDFKVGKDFLIKIQSANYM